MKKVVTYLTSMFLSMLLCVPPSSWAAIAFNESQQNTADPSVSSLALPAANVAANSLIVACGQWSGVGVTLTSITGGDSLTLLTPQIYGVGVQNSPVMQCGYKLQSSANASYVLTFNLSAGATFRRGIMYEFTYTGTASLDGEIGSTDLNTTLDPATNTLSTSGADEVCVAFHADSNSETFTAELINGVARDARALIGTDTDAFYKIFTNSFSNGTATLHRNTQPSNWIQRVTCFKTDQGLRRSGGGPIIFQ